MGKRNILGTDSAKAIFGFLQTTHKTFIVIASRLFAETYRLPVHEDEDEDTTFQVLLKLHPTPFHPRQGMHIPVTDEEIPTLPSASSKKSMRSMIVRKLNCFR